MNGIGWAVKEMQNGSRVRRAGWNGKNMFLFYVTGGEMEHPAVPAATAALPYAAMRTAQGDAVPWLCSQTDLFALDWELAE